MGHIMSSRARKFLDRWELEHLGPEDRKLRKLVQLAARERMRSLRAYLRKSSELPLGKI